MQARVGSLSDKDKLAEMCARRMLSDIEGEFGDICDFADRLTGFPEEYLLRLAKSSVDCLDLSGCLTVNSAPHCIIASAEDAQRYEGAGTYSGLPAALSILNTDITAKAERGNVRHLDHVHLSISDKDPHLVRWTGRASNGYFHPIGRVMVILDAAHILYPEQVHSSHDR